ncbi:MAG: NAD-dependent succinate-semialdehyde dehydrogenase [Chloroflexi bacterium]|nr:NAD-dependent succinate-semialdehyde dehydrogenase [Chloroflexota bacterium]MCC6896336.1 NAD-dependent succinate-semialdehyde dehydrogenase [Anaerolineae bacterium]
MSDFIFKQLINGEWVGASNGGTWALLNPATEEKLLDIPFGDAEDARAAIDAAAAAFPAWSRKTPYQRAEVLMKAADWILARVDELAVITTEESGKPLSESLAEWRSAANYIIWNAEEAKRAYGRTIPARLATRRIMVLQQPLGVVGTITAWNFPVYNVVRCWSAALAAGCTVVGRPSEYTPRSAMMMAQAFHESGAPAGVINCINGDAAAMGQVMLQDERLRKISFTGSTRVGKLLMDGASQTVTKLSLELGGNAPCIIFPDVNVEEVAKLSVAWKYRNAGQVCVAPQRFYVHSKIADEFTDRVAKASRTLRVGNGLIKSTETGPLINAVQRDRVEAMVNEAVAAGATTLSGGSRPCDMPAGYFYSPTVVTGLKDSMRLYTEEIFGPVMPIVTFDDTDEVLAMANATQYGLAAFVQTNDLNTSVRMYEGLEFGMVCINDWLPATPEAPFGGIKQSGLGRESGSEGLEEYMERKMIMIGGLA